MRPTHLPTSTYRLQHTAFRADFVAFARRVAHSTGSTIPSPSWDDQLKLFATTTMLRFRRDERAIFDDGADTPLIALVDGR
jgi:maltooligosyltrehalose synthase